MENENRYKAHFTEHIDSSIIAKFPPGFLQKGMNHILSHQNEEFIIQVTGSRVILWRMKKQVNGIRPKDPINGQIITWCPLKLENQ